MHEFILGHGLHHEHPLLSQVGKDLWNVRVEVVVDAVEEDVAEEGHPGSADSGAAVNQNRRVAVPPGRDLGGGVRAQRRQLLQKFNVLEQKKMTRSIHVH